MGHCHINWAGRNVRWTIIWPDAPTLLQASSGSAQRFLSIQSATYNTFYHQRHLHKRPMFKELRTASFEVWLCASVAI